MNGHLKLAVSLENYAETLRREAVDSEGADAVAAEYADGLARALRTFDDMDRPSVTAPESPRIDKEAEGYFEGRSAFLTVAFLQGLDGDAACGLVVQRSCILDHLRMLVEDRGNEIRVTKEECLSRVFGTTEAFWALECSEPVKWDRFEELFKSLLAEDDRQLQIIGIGLAEAVLAAHKQGVGCLYGDTSRLSAAEFASEAPFRHLLVDIRRFGGWLVSKPLRQNLMPASLRAFLTGRDSADFVAGKLAECPQEATPDHPIAPAVNAMANQVDAPAPSVNAGHAPDRPRRTRRKDTQKEAERSIDVQMVLRIDNRVRTRFPKLDKISRAREIVNADDCPARYRKVDTVRRLISGTYSSMPVDSSGNVANRNSVTTNK